MAPLVRVPKLSFPPMLLYILLYAPCLTHQFFQSLILEDETTCIPQTDTVNEEQNTMHSIQTLRHVDDWR